MYEHPKTLTPYNDMKEENKMDKSFHYTSPKMAKDLIELLSLSGSILDAGSGKNKVWQKEIGPHCFECEDE